MMVKDKIYGVFEVKESVLGELLKAPAVLRLKKISQFGIPDQYYHYKNFSRYEHSVGTMLLLRLLGATLEEQVAGLLHDVSVLAFSHVADWVFGQGRNGVEDYHDQIHQKFVVRTEIPSILKKHGFSVDDVLDDKNFGLLEKPAPDLCADRVDYALREFYDWQRPEIVQPCLQGLIGHDDRIVFNDKALAFLFAQNYLDLQTKHWGGRQAMIRYHLFSQILAGALEAGIISQSDFFQDEASILEKIKKKPSKQTNIILSALQTNNLSSLIGKTSEKLVKKFRYVDPKVLIGQELFRLSDLDKEFVKILEHHRTVNQQGLIV